MLGCLLQLYLAAQFIFHGEIDKADARCHQCVNEPHRVQTGLEL